MGFKSRAISARVTKQIVTIFSKTCDKFCLSYPYVRHTFSTLCIRFVFVQERVSYDFFLSTLTYANVLHQFFIRWHTLAKTL